MRIPIAKGIMIHIFKLRDGWRVWTDCEAGEEYSGRCIGSSSSKATALDEARIELMTDLATVQHLLECESPPSKNPSPAA